MLDDFLEGKNVQKEYKIVKLLGHGKGLLSVDKDNNGYRNYSAQDVETLKKISVYRKLGTSIKDIQSLLETGDKSILLRIYQEKMQEKVLKDSELDNVNDRMCRELGLYYNSNYNFVIKKDKVNFYNVRTCFLFFCTL